MVLRGMVGSVRKWPWPSLCMCRSKGDLWFFELTRGWCYFFRRVPWLVWAMPPPCWRYLLVRWYWLEVLGLQVCWPFVPFMSVANFAKSWFWTPIKWSWDTVLWSVISDTLVQSSCPNVVKNWLCRSEIDCWSGGTTFISLEFYDFCSAPGKRFDLTMTLALFLRSREAQELLFLIFLFPRPNLAPRGSNEWETIGFYILLASSFSYREEETSLRLGFLVLVVWI